MLRRAPVFSAFSTFSARLAIGPVLWVLLAVPLTAALSGCAGQAQTAQHRKTERYKRQHPPGTRIPCPTKDC